MMKWGPWIEDEQFAVGQPDIQEDFFGRRYVVTADFRIVISSRTFLSLFLPHEGYAYDSRSRLFTVMHSRGCLVYRLITYLEKEDAWIAEREGIL